MGLIREENPAENPTGDDGEWYTEEAVALMSLEQKTNRLRSLTTLLKRETQRVGEKIDVELPEFTEEMVLQLSDELVARYMNTIGDLLDEYAQYEWTVFLFFCFSFFPGKNGEIERVGGPFLR